ncbi:MAG: SulP family inorganic anion transporter [Caldilineaceae bacterium]|nr:SulP family inorganic anion transporter [Caldilineaceae bacterium]
MSFLNFDLKNLKGDFFGGLTSTVVGLPIALAFGVASGLGALAGLYGAIAVGFFASMFGGTRSQISGPTGSMTVLMAAIMVMHAENLTQAIIIILMAGVIQILLGVFRIGRFVSFTPYSVVSGFMSGVGIIIMVVQTLPFLGWAVAEGGPVGAIRAWPEAIRNFDPKSLAIGAVSLVVAVALPERARKYVPPPLAALAVGTLLAIIWLQGTPVIGEVPTGLPQIQWPVLSPDLLIGSIAPAITLALLGSIDSLLTSLVADAMTRTQHNPNRELIGQGIGNFAAGLIGGVPGAGSTPGTVVNLRAGGSSGLSGMLRSGLLLALVMGLGKYVSVIPHAALAGILLKVGWDIVDWRFMKRLHKVRREHLIVMVVTLGLTVFVDLVTAVAFGLIAAGFASALQFERLELDSVVSVPLLNQTFFGITGTDVDDDPFSAHVGLVRLNGTFTVASATRLIKVISLDVQEHEVVILDFTDTHYVDDSAALVIEQLIDTALDEDTDCIVTGLDGDAAATLEALNVLERIPSAQIVASVDDAKPIAAGLLGFEGGSIVVGRA